MGLETTKSIVSHLRRLEVKNYSVHRLCSLKDLGTDLWCSFSFKCFLAILGVHSFTCNYIAKPSLDGHKPFSLYVFVFVRQSSPCVSDSSNAFFLQTRHFSWTVLPISVWPYCHWLHLQWLFPNKVTFWGGRGWEKWGDDSSTHKE